MYQRVIGIGPKPAKRAKVRKPIKRGKAPAKVRKTTLAALKRKLWSLFTAYVKERDGHVCFTCDKPISSYDCQGGHLISRKIAATFFHPDNVHPQCGSCNCGKRGNVPEYTLRFLARYGEAKYRALLASATQVRQWKPHEIRELIDAIQRGGADFECLYADKYGLREEPTR